MNVGIGFIPKSVQTVVVPLRWYELAMPWRWPKSARTYIVYRSVEVTEVSVLGGKPAQ